MKRPRFLACKKCKDRCIGCHSARCPHGWGEYEKQYLAYMVKRGRQKAAMIQTAEIKEVRTRRVLATNDRRKYWMHLPTW